MFPLLHHAVLLFRGAQPSQDQGIFQTAGCDTPQFPHHRLVPPFGQSFSQSLGLVTLKLVSISSLTEHESLPTTPPQIGRAHV